MWNLKRRLAIAEDIIRRQQEVIADMQTERASLLEENRRLRQHLRQALSAQIQSKPDKVGNYHKDDHS